jgi:hypothetical protein
MLCYRMLRNGSIQSFCAQVLTLVLSWLELMETQIKDASAQPNSLVSFLMEVVSDCKCGKVLSLAKKAIVDNKTGTGIKKMEKLVTDKAKLVLEDWDQWTVQPTQDTCLLWSDCHAVGHVDVVWEVDNHQDSTKPG